MNTLQIEQILSEDEFVSPLFRGVFARDRLPKFECGAYVVNTDAAKKPGQHWVAVFATRRTVEFFDSYGRKPSAGMIRWWKGRDWISNPIRLQSPLSAVCGQYCIYFLVHRARGIDLNTMLLDFGKNLDENDRVVYEFVNSCYDVRGLKLLNTEGVLSQLAEAEVSNPRIRKLVFGQ